MAKGSVNSGTGGSGKSTIIVSIDSGSTVYLTNQGGRVKNANEKNGTWTFKGCGIGTWTVTATKNGQTATRTVSITEENQMVKYYVDMSYFSATIAVTYPSGSTCTCTKGSTVLTASTTTGSYTFTVPETGTWTVKAVKGSDSASATVSITANGQSKSVTLSYQLYASDFDWDNFGTLNTDYKIVNDSGSAISKSNWATTKNWNARILTSKSLKALKAGKIDVFLVGGGGGGGGGTSSQPLYYVTGGGGGKTTTAKNVSVTANTDYAISIGAGGAIRGSGGKTTAFGKTANGGGGGGNNETATGGSGGSGGGGRGTNGIAGTNGGNGGGDGGGTGQGTTTREFGESGRTLYSTGGNGGANATNNGAPNTGFGSDGSISAARKGWSGIVVIRNARG